MVRSVGQSLLGEATLVDAEGVYFRACAAVELQMSTCEAVHQRMIAHWSEEADGPEASDVLAVLTEVAQWVTDRAHRHRLV
jgi:hypothetical protein